MTQLGRRIRALVLNFINLKKNEGKVFVCCISFCPICLFLIPCFFSLIATILYTISFFFAYMGVDPTELAKSLKGAIKIEEFNFDQKPVFMGEGVCDINGTGIFIEFERNYYYYSSAVESSDDVVGNVDGMYEYKGDGEYCVRSPRFSEMGSIEELNEKYEDDLRHRLMTLIDNETLLSAFSRREVPVYNVEEDDPDVIYDYSGINAALVIDKYDNERYKIDYTLITNSFKWRYELHHLITNSLIDEFTLYEENVDKKNKLAEGNVLMVTESKPAIGLDGIFPGASNLGLLMDLEPIINDFQRLAFYFMVLCYPLGLSFFFSIFASERIKERNEGILEFISLYGVSRIEYELIRLFFDYLSYVVFMILAIIVPIVVTGPQYFLVDFPEGLISYLETNVYFLILYIFWGFALISMSYIFSMFQNNPSQANAYGLLLVVMSSFVGGLLNIYFFNSFDPAPWYYMLYPPFALSKGISYLICRFLSKEDIKSPTNEYFGTILWYLFLEALVLFLFFLFYPYVKKYTEIGYNYLKFKIENAIKNKGQIDDNGEENASNIGVGEEVEYDPTTMSISIKNLTKRFGNYKAVNNVSFFTKKNECFSLLGPNGAGKTTLLKLLTGEHNLTSGSAIIGGNNLTTNRPEIQKIVSICPQFDVLWSDLSVREHLLLFCRLRGVPIKKEKEYVDDLIAEVNLSEHKRKSAGSLSGGMRRRLSISIALCGSPQVVLLDEPTTGLDPNSRRSVWKVIAKAKEKRCVILTTHSLDEAEMLSDRIGIMASGKLKCLGKLFELKKEYSKGYKLHVDCKGGYLTRADEYIRKILPTVADQHIFAESMSYRIPTQDIKISKIFEQLSPQKARLYGILDWTINQASLEEVFIKFAQEDEDEKMRNYLLSKDQKKKEKETITATPPAINTTSESSDVAIQPIELDVLKEDETNVNVEVSADKTNNE